MVGAIKGCTGQEPTIVGKPSPLMIDYIVEKYNVERCVGGMGCRRRRGDFFGTSSPCGQGGTRVVHVANSPPSSSPRFCLVQRGHLVFSVEARDLSMEYCNSRRDRTTLTSEYSYHLPITHLPTSFMFMPPVERGLAHARYGVEQDTS